MPQEIKKSPLEGYKTYLVSGAMFLAGIAADVLSGVDWHEFFKNPSMGSGMILSAIVMAAMRKLTEKTTVQTALKTPPPASPE